MYITVQANNSVTLCKSVIHVAETQCPSICNCDKGQKCRSTYDKIIVTNVEIDELSIAISSYTTNNVLKHSKHTALSSLRHKKSFYFKSIPFCDSVICDTSIELFPNRLLNNIPPNY